MSITTEHFIAGDTNGIDYAGLETVLPPAVYAAVVFRIACSETASRAPLDALADMGIGSKTAAHLAADLLFQHEVSLATSHEDA